mmetsp:Transcript_13788/g.41010  ORF Transcript_13788/g.41010 Transcript_13788/m.41010 type:complete len:252 (+) Transcript_13788:170-925(+)
MSAGSNFSGWFVVMTRIRLGESTTPSRALSSPDKLSLSLVVGSDGPMVASLPEPPVAASRLKIPAAAALDFSSSSSATPEHASADGLAGGSASFGCLVVSPSSLSCDFSLCFARCGSDSESEPPPPLAPSSSSKDSKLAFLGRFACAVTSAAAAWTSSLPSLPSRRCTIFEMASTSSITKMTSLKRNLIGTSWPRIWYLLSNITSMSSAFVWMRASGTLTMFRFVWCANALIIEVLPVPGGPCSNKPNLCG